MSEGNKTIADRWHLFEEACESAGPGDLPQLLRSLKGMSTPTPTSQPLTLSPMVTSKAPAPLPTPVKMKQEALDLEEPVVIRIEGKRKWSCPQCGFIKGSKNGCDAHIRETHSKKALLCALWSFYTFNMDSLNRYVKEHN